MQLVLLLFYLQLRKSTVQSFQNFQVHIILFFSEFVNFFHHSSFAPHWSRTCSFKTVCLRQHLNWIITGKNRCLKATCQLHKLVPLLKCLLKFLRPQYTQLFSLRLPDTKTEIFWFTVFNNFLKPSVFSSDILCLMICIPFHWFHLMGFPISGILLLCLSEHFQCSHYLFWIWCSPFLL